MKKLLPRKTYGHKAIRVVVLLAFSVALHAASSAQLHDENKSDALNLVRANNGAEIECTTPDGRVEFVTSQSNKGTSPLVLSDETLSCPLQQGRTTFVIKLPSTSLLDRFTFVNENAAAAGELNISVSNYQLPASSPKWVEVDGSVSFSRKRLFNLSMVGVEARYLRLSFNVESGGRIGALGLYGGQRLDHSAWKSAGNQQLGLLAKSTHSRHLERVQEFDYAALSAKARVVYVSSGPIPSTGRMIDNNNETGFSFAPSDSHPTVIVELAASETIHRVTALYRMRTPGRLDVYLLNDMGKSATDLKYLKPIASVTDEDGDGDAAVDFDPEGARYVGLRFTAFGSPGNDRPFEMVEIGAYGDMPRAMVEMEAPDLYASNYGAAPFPGQSSPEISSKLGTLAIPPILPEVSP